MRRNWKKVLAAVCTVVMLVTMPGTSVLADNMQEEELLVADAEVPEEMVESLAEDDIDRIEARIEENNVNKNTVEEIVGADWAVLGGDVEGAFYEETGAVKLISHSDGEPVDYWIDLLNCPNREAVKSIEVVLGTVYLPDKSDYMFKELVNLTDIDLSGFNTSRVLSMVGLFRACSSLTSIDFSSFDTSKVLDMHEMFYDCTSLQSLDLSSFDTSNVGDGMGDMAHMFGNCSSLTSIDLSSFDTSKVEDMRYMFEGCSRLTSLDLSSFDVSNTTEMGSMFYRCYNLQLICTPKNNSQPVDLPIRMYDSSGKAYTHLPNTTESIVLAKTQQMAQEYERLKVISLAVDEDVIGPGDIELGGGVTATFDEKTGAVGLYSDNGYLVNDWFSTDRKSVKSIKVIIGTVFLDFEACSVFEGLDNLIDLDLSDFDTSRTVGMASLFRGCKSLKSIDLCSFDTSNVLDMSEMFYDCTSLQSLDLSSFDTSNVGDGMGDMAHMFGNCSSLTSIDLSSFDTSNVEDMRYMFEGCSSLTSLDLSSFDVSNATVMGGMFYDCYNLQLICTPKNNSQPVDLPITMYDSAGRSYTHLPNTTESIVLAKTQQMAQEYEKAVYLSKYFINDADRFLISNSVQRVVKYLHNENNFANSCYVEQVDSDFFTDLAEAETNMLFRGLDGWKDIFTKATKVEKAEEILAGLLQSYEAEVNELATAKTAEKWAECYLDGLKLYMSAHALSNKSLDQITNKDIIKQLQKGEFDEIVEYLVKNKSLDTVAVNTLKDYHTSQYFADGISKGLDFLDTGLTVAQLSLDTVNRFYKLEALAEADEIYSEMLLYLSQNCNYEVVQRAAQNLYNVIHGSYTDQLLYVTVALQNELESQVIDKTLDQAAEAIPYGVIIKKTFDFSVDAANLLFKTGSVQEEKDCMRICTFVGKYLSRWVNENQMAYLSTFESGDEVLKRKYARLFCYSLYMLAETRVKGEESIQSMLKKSELPFWKMTSTSWYKSSEQSLSKVNNIITLLKNEKGFKFYCSTVVSCPVNVEVYDANSNLVTTVYDGQESSGAIGEVSYDVYYNPIDGDYDKILHLPENEGYTIKIIGTDLGKVDCQMSSIDEEGNLETKAFDNIPIAKDDVIRIDNIAVEQQEYSIIRDKTQEKQTFNDVADIYKEVERISLEKHELELEPESKTVMRVSYLPADASSKEGYWTSSDASVAEINKEGVITTHKEGSTILTCISYDSDSIFDSCKVIVKNKNSGGISAYRFSDVQNPNHAYFKAIYWAADAGITKGYPDGTFGIDRSCTRGEMMMFLWRYAGKPAPKNVSKSPFKDVPKTHTFYKAILWGSQKGITKGYSDGTFGINRNVSRGECMMFLWRLKGKPAPKAVAKSPFPDVPKSHVFYNAVLWGYQKKITTGFTSGKLKGKFGVNENCSRGQIVTFLYRAK